MKELRPCRWCAKGHRNPYQAELCRARADRQKARALHPIAVKRTVTRVGAAAGRRFAPTWLRKMILERDGYRCRYCGVAVTDATANMDHVIPWPEGMTEESNLVTSCRPCNQSKGSQRVKPNPIDAGDQQQRGGTRPRQTRRRGQDAV